jgi:hypothetical protein
LAATVDEWTIGNRQSGIGLLAGDAEERQTAAFCQSIGPPGRADFSGRRVFAQITLPPAPPRKIGTTRHIIGSIGNAIPGKPLVDFGTLPSLILPYGRNSDVNAIHWCFSLGLL